ncbi:MAG: hypothetical protein O3B86_00530 [Planctomycetota bacterium]|nr:hypothetical protein [Planctomycetota bacterium]
MPGRQKPLFKPRLAPVTLPIAAVAAALAAVITMMIWQSPRFIVADVKPLILEFGQSSGGINEAPPDFVEDDGQGYIAQGDTALPNTVQREILDTTPDVVRPAGKPIKPSVQFFGSRSQPLEPVRTDRANGSLVLEWPKTQARKQPSKLSVEGSQEPDLKSQASRIREEAQAFLEAGDLRRALRSARLACSYPVEWQAWEKNPKDLLAELEALLDDDNVVEAARQAVIAEIMAANGKSASSQASPNRRNDVAASNSFVARDSAVATTGSVRDISAVDLTSKKPVRIGIWEAAPKIPDHDRRDVVPPDVETSSPVPTAFPQVREPAPVTMDDRSDDVPLTINADISPEPRDYRVSGQNDFERPAITHSESIEIDVDPQSAGFAVAQDASVHHAESPSDEPASLYPAHSQYVSGSTTGYTIPAPFPSDDRLDRRPLFNADQQAVVTPSDSRVQTITFDVLATLITIFAVLFFGTLFLLLTVLAMGRKLLGEKGISFKIELVNSPLTVQSGALAASAGASTAADPITSSVPGPMKLDPDFEGILSMSEQRARKRESAILQQFIENNVSLHSEIRSSKRAA